MLPALYNNHKKIIQTEDTIVIQIEMVHETRIVRMNAEHDPAEIQKWLGDSIGWWEGDTLVVETTNFRDTPNFSRGSANMKVTERFDYESPERVIYSLSARHEANYALEGIMKGARVLEMVYRGEDPGGVANPTN